MTFSKSYYFINNSVQKATFASWIDSGRFDTFVAKQHENVMRTHNFSLFRLDDTVHTVSRLLDCSLNTLSNDKMCDDGIINIVTKIVEKIRRDDHKLLKAFKKI